MRVSARPEQYVLDQQGGPEGIIEYLRTVNDIPGWFELVDVLLFQKIDELQLRKGIKGNLLEVGVYQGKSAILLGYFCRDGEQLVVCDLFESVPAAMSVDCVENGFYQGCSRRTFERNYLRFHKDLPTILACSSTDMERHAPSNGFRFVHIDGSHHYDIIRADIQTARNVLGRGGVVAFDDFQNPRTPGVTAAVMEEVFHGGLLPLCYTTKLYATWETETVEGAAELGRWAAEHPLLQATTHVIFGHEVVHVTMRKPAPSPIRTFVHLVTPPGLAMLRDSMRHCVRAWRRRQWN
jgi:hypothetical protein